LLHISFQMNASGYLTANTRALSHSRKNKENEKEKKG